MDWPTSLPAAVLSRSFRAANGELGVKPEDAAAFLDACEADRVELLGWELWLADHAYGWGAPSPAPGRWSHAIPIRGQSLPCVVGGDGDLAATRAQIAGLDLDALMDAQWRGHARINFTLAD